MAISLNNHEERIKNAELELPKIQSRIDNLVASGKDYAVYTVKGESNTTVDSKWSSCNMCLISCSITAETYYNNDGVIDRANIDISSSTSRINAYGTATKGRPTFYINKNGTKLSISISNGDYHIDIYRATATVLLYK